MGRSCRRRSRQRPQDCVVQPPASSAVATLTGYKRGTSARAQAGTGVHLEGRETIVVLDQRLQPRLPLRKQVLEVVPSMLDDRPELVEEHVVDLAGTASPVPGVVLLVRLVPLRRLRVDRPLGRSSSTRGLARSSVSTRTSSPSVRGTGRLSRKRCPRLPLRGRASLTRPSLVMKGVPGSSPGVGFQRRPLARARAVPLAA